MHPVAIYALVDPRSNIARYIGQSVSPESRYLQHIRGKTEASAAKRAWIEELRSLGLVPTLRILEWSDSEQVHAREHAWLAHAQAEHWPLLNVYGVEKRYTARPRRYRQTSS